ncbi:citrate lyase holo-[acyl-carrier protein] synthase [Acetobacter thailandicus]|uniref:citrate lyase holo-[acyl-carrier protein] synthase n=1 Tax=Acetobacter thailandicus TaxID=1502842 RepID=UPI001BA9D3CC|nr:citrate lyase holo-[acyl-carrier protein] synthase [Acetobacter thailandicus]MBS1003354.1 citrate lyase holo-[acyl-carrier protein] synthase [Acetobacter thailandicus]
MSQGLDTFHTVLRAREDRARRQHELLNQFNLPLISATVVAPGPNKSTALYRDILDVAQQTLREVFSSPPWKIVHEEAYHSPAGPEAFFVISGSSASDIKNAVVQLEETHPIGRLWDLDVILPDMTILSRQQFGLPPRRCLVCDNEALGCARSRAHTLSQLKDKIKSLFELYRKERHM